MKRVKGSRLKRFAGLWIVLLVGLFVYMSEGRVEAKNGTWSGKGTAEDPYLIEDVADLQALQTRVNRGDSFSADYFSLTANLDLSEVCGENIGSWVPIGNESHHFSGFFSGESNKISGLYINAADTVGLFGVSDGKIERLSVSGSVSGKNFVGGIVGKNQGIIDGCSSKVKSSGSNAVGGIAGYSEGQISNCLNADTVSGTTYVGGIVGSTASSVTSCTNKATITSTSTGAGGIAGLCNEAWIAKCINEGDVNGGKDITGGIVGEYRGKTNNSDSYINYCTNSGNISGVSDYVGGIVGSGFYCTMTECINSGTVAGSGYAGGIAGQLKNHDSITKITNHGTVTGTDIVGGIVGLSDNSGDIKTCYNDGAVSGQTMIGGIVGAVILTEKQPDSSFKINNIIGCTNEGKVTGTSQIGGISGSCSANVLGCINKGEISGQNDLGGIFGVMKDEQNYCENCVNMGEVKGAENVGGIVGSGGAVIIRKCRNDGPVDGTSKNVGGIIGLNTIPEGIDLGEIKQCKNENIVSNSGSNTGGIIGRAAYISILECENTATITAGNDKMGGIIGYGIQVTVKRCGNTGSLTGKDIGVGGIAGYAVETNISDCYNRGTVYGEDRVGGLVGIFDEDNCLNRCYVKAQKNGITCERENGYVGGFYGTLSVASNVKFQDCYWWSFCANRALGSDRPDATDYSGEGYAYYRIEDMFEVEINFRNWDFREIWVINGNVPVLRNTYDISPTGGVGANEEADGRGYQVNVKWYSDGKLLEEEIYNVGDTPAYKGKTPTRDSDAEYDYTFTGWDKELEELTDYTSFNAVFKKTKRHYDITWKNDDGTVIDVTKVACGTVPAHATPSRKGDAQYVYTFSGWIPGLKAVTGDAAYTASYSKTAKKTSVTGVNLDKSTVSITKGKTTTLKATVLPKNAANKKVTWTSSNKKVADVDGKGKVTAKKEGKTTITVITDEGRKKATCTVTVIAPIKSIRFAKSTYSVFTGKTQTLSVKITPSGASGQQVLFKSSNKKIATVDTKGKVTGVNEGTVTITATSSDRTKKATCKVKVKEPNPVKQVNVLPARASLKVGKTIRLKAVILPSNAKNKQLTWTVKDKRIATISPNGTLKGIRKGTTYVTVTTANGKKSKKVPVTVR